MRNIIVYFSYEVCRELHLGLVIFFKNEVEGFTNYKDVNVSKDCSQGDEVSIQRASTFIHPLDVVRVYQGAKNQGQQYWKQKGNLKTMQFGHYGILAKPPLYGE